MRKLFRTSSGKSAKSFDLQQEATNNLAVEAKDRCGRLQAFLGAAAAVVCGTTARNNGAGFPEPGVLPTRFQQNRTEFSWIFIALAVVTGFLGLSLLAVPFATFEPSKWRYAVRQQSAWANACHIYNLRVSYHTDYRPLATPMGSYLLRNYGCSVLFSSILFYTLKASPRSLCRCCLCPLHELLDQDIAWTAFAGCRGQRTVHVLDLPADSTCHSAHVRVRCRHLFVGRTGSGCCQRRSAGSHIGHFSGAAAEEAAEELSLRTSAECM